jgi:hypothetical protein
VNTGRALVCVDDEGRFAEIPTIPSFDQPAFPWAVAPIAVDGADRIYAVKDHRLYMIAPPD